MATDTGQQGFRPALTLAALGIVFGDIGTSPLYAFRESFLGLADLDVTAGHVFGVLSMIFWSLIIVISIKYLTVVMRADNAGEGGLIALVSLLRPNEGPPRGLRRILIVLGVFGAALLYGDGTITPAISVLSALEGLEVATDTMAPFIIPLTIVILVLLFSFQRHGTAKIGKVFGPVMLVWFATLGILGIVNLLSAPAVLQALNPWWALKFLAVEPMTAFLVLGTVFLVVTGGEALYADMGHFGRGPIRQAWFFLVLPCLLLNYFGQGALVISDNREILHPFFHSAPDWALYPLVALSTLATVIASQAVISGVFSLTRQAIQLGQLPRMQVIQTHGEEFGQIYIPVVNWMLMVATTALVLGFRTSSNLASAYGLAIAMDMVITTILTMFVLRHWRWSLPLLGLMILVFLPLDLSFLVANALKFLEGGWYPVLAGLVLFTLMTTWSTGKRRVREELQDDQMPVDDFLKWLAGQNVARTDGTAIFLTSMSRGTPAILLHHVEFNRALHEHVVLLHIESHPVGMVAADRRIEIEKCGPDFHRVTLNYGFNEPVDVPRRLQRCKKQGLAIEVDERTTYYLGRETLISRKMSGMSAWRNALFARMARNAGRATTFYRIPREQVVELGIHIEI